MTTTTITAPLKGDAYLQSCFDLVTRLTAIEVADLIDEIQYHEDEFGTPTREFIKSVSYYGWKEACVDEVYTWLRGLMYWSSHETFQQLQEDGDLTKSPEITALYEQLKTVFDQKSHEGSLLQMINRLNKMSEVDREFVLSRVS